MLKLARQSSVGLLPNCVPGPYSRIRLSPLYISHQSRFLSPSLSQNRQFSASLVLNTVKTVFPTLSYKPEGFTWSQNTHSSVKTDHRTYPRTDLARFTPWDTFESEIHDAITTHMTAMNIASDVEYDIGLIMKKQRIVENEEDVRYEARAQLHDLVEVVLRILGIDGRFALSGTGNNQIVGDPDFSWFRNPTKHPKVVVEYKTKWAAPLVDLPAYFRRNESHNVPERQSIDAVLQLYGYMTFNDNKYGILSNMQYAWFFQRVQTANGKGRSLQYYGPIDINVDSVHTPSMLKAFVGTILLTETASTWFHTSMSDIDSPPDRYFRSSDRAIRDRDITIVQAHSYNSTPMAGSYPVLPLDPRLCRFNRSSVHHSPERGCTLKATLERSSSNLKVFCKIADLSCSYDAVSVLDTEVRNYAALQNLQGVVIPQVHGYYNVWGLLKLLALEVVGTTIPEDAPIDVEMRMQMKSALSRIHSAGYVHGDIARRNFCKRGKRIFLVDLQTLAVGSTIEMEDELAAVDAL